MKFAFALAAILFLHSSQAQEKLWSWNGDDNDQNSQQSDQKALNQFEEYQPSASEYVESAVQLNDTDVEKVVDEILTSSRLGRALDGFGEVYSDPTIQDVLQKGDDGEARNIIKEKLCSLGLMQCDEHIEGKRPFIAPEELVYAQPVAINPVGKPIPTIPVKGVRGGYGPPQPVHYPSRPGGPPGKFGPPPNKFGPQGKPPRRHFGPPGPPSKPFYGKPTLNGEYFDGPEYLSKPPGFAPGDFIPPLAPEGPYKFEQGAFQSGHHKDKRVEITVNAQGGAATASGVSTVGPGAAVEHVHHHYHHNLNGGNKPTVVVNPIPIAAAAVSATSESLSNSFGSGSGSFGGSSGSFGGSTGSFSGNSGSFGGSSGSYGGSSGSFGGSSGSFGGSSGSFGSNSGSFGKPDFIPISSGGFSGSFDSSSSGLTLGGTSGTYGPTIGGLTGSSYGGQSIANYGGSSSFGVNSFDSIKPVTENFGTSIGSYGSSGLYKKKLNLNAVNNNYLQSNYADKYQGLESARTENYDCVCVPYNQCPSHDIIGRKDDLYLPLDPRSLKSDIEAAVEEERIITDGNGTMTVVRIPKGADFNATDSKDTEGKKISKREATDKTTENTSAKPEARQFSGAFGRPQTCGPRHVCCRRPYRPQVPQSANRQCGTRHAQGINGRIKNPVYVDGDSEFGEYPWQVAILKKDSKESVYVCGGTLIDPLHIITAAHCVKTYTGFDLRVRLGEWDVNHDVEFYPYIERDIESVHVHPEFYAGTLYNDIAILRMDKPVDWSKQPHISPACLPHLHDDYTGSRCWTTGWGKDAFGDYGKYQNILKEVDVPVVNHAVCQRQLQQTRLGYDFKLHPGFVCAGGEEGKDACKGDGGGPMVCERGGTWQLVGVVSWGIGCGQVGVPGVYVKVAHYLDWIKQITQRF